MRSVAVINQKGGCGKTTISINLASCLAQAGKKTLLVDMDPQSHCAVGLAVPEEQIEQSIYDVLIGTSRDEPLEMRETLWQISENLELVPASIDLAAFDQQMAGVIDRENCLRDIIMQVEQKYDYVIIDCPPSVGLLTFNALRAATDVIVPVETGYFSLHGLSKQLETLSILCKQCSQQINVMVLASMYDVRTKMGREILGELKKHFAQQMFKTIINFNTKLKEAASIGQPINEYEPASKGHKDFAALVDELISSNARVERVEQVDLLDRELDAISSSADELLAMIDPAASDETDKIKDVADLDSKLADFYGIRQFGEAVTFATLYPRAETVQIAGDFNNWQPEKTVMQKVGDNGCWQLKLPLGPGRYRYRLVVDGKWQQDPYNEKMEMNPYGEFNSIVEVK